MDCRLQVSCSGLWEFVVPYSNPVIFKTKNIFSVFYSIYGISIKFWTFFKKKKIVMGNVFPKLATVQGLVTPLTIQRRLKTSFDSQHIKRFQTVVKSSWEHFYHIFSALWGEMIWKISPWMKFEIIGFFFNTWTADYKYRVLDCENLPFRIQIQLSWKQKTLSGFFIPFMESPSNFKHFLKKEDSYS